MNTQELAEKCPYHNELVNEVSEIKYTLSLLNETCKHLNETTIKSKEFYEQMMIHYDKESNNEVMLSKRNVLLLILVGIIGGFIGFTVPV